MKKLLSALALAVGVLGVATTMTNKMQDSNSSDGRPEEKAPEQKEENAQMMKRADIDIDADTDIDIDIDMEADAGQGYAAADFEEHSAPLWKHSPLCDESEIAGVVLGEKVPARRVEAVARLLRAGNMEMSLIMAWEIVKQQIYEKHFAEDHNLMPSEQEILQFTQSMRDLIEGSVEGLASSNIMINAMGITVNEYWNEYRLHYESPTQLIRMRIDQYLGDGFMAQLDGVEIKGEITSKELLRRFGM